MGNKETGASFTSYVSYSSFGLYVRWGAEEITGFSKRDWGGFYLTGKRHTDVMPSGMMYAAALVSFAPPVLSSHYGAIEIRPWGFPIPFGEIEQTTRITESQLRRMIAAVLTPNASSLDSRWTGHVLPAVVD